MALGKIAFDTCIMFYREKFEVPKDIQFGHGKTYKLKNGVNLVGCYHPSPRNVNTGRINEKMMTDLFLKIKNFN